MIYDVNFALGKNQVEKKNNKTLDQQHVAP
jgi:hypothetical protein